MMRSLVTLGAVVLASAGFASVELGAYLDYLRNPAFADREPEELVGMPATSFELHRTLKVVYADAQVVSFEQQEEAYTGGAHSECTTTVGSLCRKTGKRLALADVIPAGKQEAARQALAAAVAEKLGVDAPDGEVQLTENFYLADDGIHFVFNRYVLASRAAGVVEVTIPRP